MDFEIDEFGQIIRESPSKKKHVIAGVVIILLVVLFFNITEDNVVPTPSEVDVEITTPKVDNLKIYLEAKALYDSENYRAALSKLEQIKDINTINGSEYYWLLGASNLNLDNYSQAINHFTKSININYRNEKSIEGRARSNYNLKNYDEAINGYSNAINLFNDNYNKASYHNMRGICFWDKGQKNKAINDFKKAYRLVPTNNTYKKNSERIIEKRKIKRSKPTNYLYITKTLFTGRIPPLKKYPNTDSENVRNNRNNETVYVLSKTTIFYFKVQIDGVVGYISSSYLQNQDYPKIKKSKTKVIKKTTKPKTFKVKVTSRVARIYSKPFKKIRYKTRDKRKRGSVLSVEVYNNKFYVFTYYNASTGKPKVGYLLKSKFD